jgi:hypothetical protein
LHYNKISVNCSKIKISFINKGIYINAWQVVSDMLKLYEKNIGRPKIAALIN